jgi:hypothetical protein
MGFQSFSLVIAFPSHPSGKREPRLRFRRNSFGDIQKPLVFEDSLPLLLSLFSHFYRNATRGEKGGKGAVNKKKKKLCFSASRRSSKTKFLFSYLVVSGTAA